jgi:RHS repeat-associated protein
LLDGLGSTRMVVDEALDVDSIQSYAPYGEPLEAGSFGSPFTFAGELLDANDLLYLRARYYNPALGVFTALDPVENLNRYQYVGANPVNFADPSGETCAPLQEVLYGTSGQCTPGNLEPCGPDPQRRLGCLNLLTIFYWGDMPTFDDLLACYGCDTSISLLENERENSYRAMITLAINDGILKQEAADIYIDRFEPYPAITPSRSTCGLFGFGCIEKRVAEKVKSILSLPGNLRTLQSGAPYMPASGLPATMLYGIGETIEQIPCEDLTVWQLTSTFLDTAGLIVGPYADIPACGLAIYQVIDRVQNASSEAQEQAIANAVINCIDDIPGPQQPALQAAAMAYNWGGVLRTCFQDQGL